MAGIGATSTIASAVIHSREWRLGMSKWCTTLPSASWYAKTRARGCVVSSNRRQRCRSSPRGCMRTSIMLSLMGALYVNRLVWRMTY